MYFNVPDRCFFNNLLVYNFYKNVLLVDTRSNRLNMNKAKLLSVPNINIYCKLDHKYYNKQKDM